MFLCCFLLTCEEEFISVLNVNLHVFPKIHSRMLVSPFWPNCRVKQHFVFHLRNELERALASDIKFPEGLCLMLDAGACKSDVTKNGLYRIEPN